MFNGITNSFDGMISSVTDFGRGVKKSFKRHSKDVREFAQSVGEMVDMQEIIKSIQKSTHTGERKSSNIIHHPINCCPPTGENEYSSVPPSPRPYRDEDEYLLFPGVSSDVLDKSPSRLNSDSSQKENSNPEQLYTGQSTRRYMIFTSRHSQNTATSSDNMDLSRDNGYVSNSGSRMYREPNIGKIDLNNSIPNGAQNEHARYVSQGPRSNGAINSNNYNKEHSNTTNSKPEITGSGKQRKTSVYRSPNFNCSPATTACMPYSPRPTRVADNPQKPARLSRKNSALVFCYSSTASTAQYSKTIQNHVVGSNTNDPKLNRSSTFSGASSTRKKTTRHYSENRQYDNNNNNKKNSAPQIQDSFKSLKESLANNNSSNQKGPRKKSQPQIEDSINFLKESFKDPNSNNQTNKKSRFKKNSHQQQQPDAIKFLKESFTNYDQNANANQSKKYRKVSTNIPPTPKTTGRTSRKHSHPFFSSLDTSQSKSSSPSIVYPPKMDFLRPAESHGGRGGSCGSRKTTDSEKGTFKDYLKPPSFGYANDVNTRSPKRTRKVYSNKRGK